MIDYRKHEPNISVTLPGWEEVCTDVLALPIRIQVDEEDYYWKPEDGPYEKAANELTDAYHSLLKPTRCKETRPDGTTEEYDSYILDDELLVRKIFGQEFDEGLRTAFANCLVVLGLNPGEIIELGEREFARYVQAEANRLTAETRAMLRVEAVYGESLPKYLDGEVLKAFKRVLMWISYYLPVPPEVIFEPGKPESVLLALGDVEDMIGRKFPRGPWLPEYVRTIGRRHYLSLYGLVLFSLGPLLKMHWANEEDAAISRLLHACHNLQYALLNSTDEGRKALDDMLGGVFGSSNIAEE